MQCVRVFLTVRATEGERMATEVESSVTLGNLPWLVGTIFAIFFLLNDVNSEAIPTFLILGISFLSYKCL